MSCGNIEHEEFLMNDPKVTAKAKAIDTKKEKIIYAITALILAFLAAAIFSNSARA